jgi:hypothetical protein
MSESGASDTSDEQFTSTSHASEKPRCHVLALPVFTPIQGREIRYDRSLYLLEVHGNADEEYLKRLVKKKRPNNVPKDLKVPKIERWVYNALENNKYIEPEKVLSLAIQTRNAAYTCNFEQGKTSMRGLYNLLLSIRFEDGLSWVVKFPRDLGTSDRDEKERNRQMYAEIGSLMFLQELGDFPAPKIYGFGPDSYNPIRTPYVFMEKLPGVTLHKAIHQKIDPDLLMKCLDDLASARKRLCSTTFTAVGSPNLSKRRGYIWKLGELLVCGKLFRSGRGEPSQYYYAADYFKAQSEEYTMRAPK